MSYFGQASYSLADAEKDRVVIVTGAGGIGCGRSISTRFEMEGAAVVVSDVNEAGGRETVREIARSGGQAAFFRADVRSESQVKELVSFADDLWRLRVLVNNASAPHGSAAIESWVDAIETDLLGAHVCYTLGH